ncbi:restriction endonuclease subunit S [Streptomyces sp. cmx-18-6]|uniref:restriction endonuclease subunit S n=1 Tax=Streptomyces sp. cmx-18-6 TaxID=2790930 RepID=UPI00397F8354
MTEWKVLTVGQVASVVTKGTTPTSVGHEFHSTGIPFVKVESITPDGIINPRKLAYISENAHEHLKRSQLQVDDVLFTIAGTIGRVARVLPDDVPANTNQAVAIVRSDPTKVSPRFMLYCLRDEQRVMRAQSRVVQSVQANLSLGELKSVEIPLPSLGEQRAIVSVLGALDDKIAVNERIAATADDLAEAHYHHERSIPITEFTRLGELAHVVVGSTPSRSKAEYWTGGTVGWINSGKANEFRVLTPSEMITEEGLSKSSVKMMPPGATLIGITGATMGQISRLEIPAGGSQNVAGVWSSNSTLNDWLFYDIKARVFDLTKHASGGAQQHINKRIIVELECAVPDVSRLAAWSEKTSPLLKTTAQVLVENRTLAALRDTLLPQLMSGRLRVGDAEKIVEDHA